MFVMDQGCPSNNFKEKFGKEKKMQAETEMKQFEEQVVTSDDCKEKAGKKKKPLD